MDLVASKTLEPITQSIQPPCVARCSLDPVWLLVKLEINSVENIEQDLVVCSSKEMIIYNAVCLMDKLTSRQFRFLCAEKKVASVTYVVDRKGKICRTLSGLIYSDC